MSSFRVLIDGKEEILTYVCRSHCGYQYNTKNNRAAHTFGFKLRGNMSFRTNGHKYVVKGGR